MSEPTEPLQAPQAPWDLQHIHGVPVLLCAPDGDPLRGEREALDLIGDAFHLGAVWVVIPAGRFEDAFFQLRTRVAGDIVQKFVNYRLRVAVVGDIARHTDGSASLRDFVRESNRGTQLWFLPDIESLSARLGPQPHES
ncbi:DUF4180 domain-containing protein [Streptomyces scopuliridis]|uniref:DUF4180 domain-containing protein n=1 Tax=Streptomyces scopuliridis TaxID=452529 RepID=A0ACD4ZR29_9ACTN|nr:DUF4180 domain-containing protein [Streptomyces scopuliridis]WSC00664.1 DUF4180 domain-containing protein [Streptomyces scopuliridis]WSC05725.1 DUF4180 domain-containing protein [Streptomyces scopuliridis]